MLRFSKDSFFAFIGYVLKPAGKDTYLFLSFLFLLLFFLFSFLTYIDLFTRLDWWFLQTFQEITPVEYDLFFSMLSVIGTFEIYTALAIIFFILGKKTIEAVYFFAVYGLGHIIEILGKTFIHHPAPPNEFLRFNLPFHLLSSGFHPGFAYPSGHSMRTVIFVLLGFWLVNRHIKSLGLRLVLLFFGLLYLLLVLYSRVSLAEHWFSDVVGGSLLGVSIALLMLSVFDFYEKYPGYKVRR